MSWSFPTLYKRSLIGKFTYWEISFDGVNKLIIKHGYVDGQEQVNTVEIVTNLSGRTMQEQAYLEANQRYIIKYRKEHYRQGNEPIYDGFKFMKGYKFQDRRDKVKYPVYVQPKLDGIRHRACINSVSEVELVTLEGIKREHFSHIKDELAKFFPYLPSIYGLDGEFYIHGYSLQKIVSITVTRKTEHDNADLMKYFIFDIVIDQQISYVDRYKILLDSYIRYINDGGTTDHFIVIGNDIANNEEEVTNLKNKYVEAGYEGAMIKMPYSSYRFGRSVELLKYKDFDDHEALCVGIEEGTGTDAGTAILVCVMELTEQYPQPRIFKLRMRGDLALRKSYFEHPETVLNKLVTYRHIGYTDDGKPHHATGVSVRDYE